MRSFWSTEQGGDFSSLGEWYVGGDGLWHQATNIAYFQPYTFVYSADATVQAANEMMLFP